VQTNVSAHIAAGSEPPLKAPNTSAPRTEDGAAVETIAASKAWVSWRSRASRREATSQFVNVMISASGAAALSWLKMYC
jgi:hypothetical protein